jgi:alpha-beta hydrolase superfamily lysophospholipase
MISPLVIVGSSMGGLLAALTRTRSFAQQRFNSTKLQAIILLAPGFGITKRWPQIIGEQGMQQLERNRLQISSFTMRRTMTCPCTLASPKTLSTIKTDSFKIDIPTIVFHGIDDQTVPIEHARLFAQLNPAAALVELDDGHELANSLDTNLATDLRISSNRPSTASDTSPLRYSYSCPLSDFIQGHCQKSGKGLGKPRPFLNYFSSYY